MGPKVNWQNTPCNLCLTYPLACTDFSGAVHDMHCDPSCAHHSIGSSFRDLEKSMGRDQKSMDAADHVSGLHPRVASIPALGDDLHSHLWACGLVGESAAHGTNRFHLPDSWAGTRLQDPKVQKSSSTAPKSVARENFWKTNDPNSLEGTVLESYLLCQFKVARDWLSTCLVLLNPCSQPYTFITHQPIQPIQDSSFRAVG